MIDYLYYKMYRAALKSSVKDSPHFFASCQLAGLIAINVLVLNAFLAKIGVVHFLFSSTGGGFFAALLIVGVMIYYNKDRREYILEKYSQENNRQRLRGNAIVITYAIVSFLLIYAVAFYKPGKL